MKLLIAALLAAFSTSAMAEWTWVGSPTDNTFDIYIDQTTIRKQGNVAKMWGMRDYKSLQKSAGGESYLSRKVFYEYDCVEIRRRVLAITSFSGNIGKGEAVLSYQYDNDNSKWQDVEPDSVGMISWKAACKK